MKSGPIEKNKVVTITYRILHEGGELAEQSDLPIDYIHGTGDDMFPKIEQALEGKQIGDCVEVLLTPQEGFGEHDPNLLFTDDIDNVPAEFRFVGAEPSFENTNGEVMNMHVSKIENGQLTVDANHPFAGKNMRFSVTVVGIRDATREELQGNRPMSPATTTWQ